MFPESFIFSYIYYPYRTSLINSIYYLKDSFPSLLNKKRHSDSNELENLEINPIANNFNNIDNSINKEDIYFYQNIKTEEKTVNKGTKSKKDIFYFKRINKNLGRRKKNRVYSSKTVNDKFRENNITPVIKRRLINSSLSYINKKISLNYNEEKEKDKYLLKKIKPNFVKAKNKKEERQYLSKKISEIFSDDLSSKYSRFKNEKDFNKKLISKIIKENKAKEVIEIFNSTLVEMYEKYISNEIADFCLNADLDEIKKKNEKKYVEEFEEKAKRLIKIINKKERAK